VSRQLQHVHVRVNDAATGKPTPCRVRFTDAEGIYYAPYGRTSQVSASFEAIERHVAGYISDEETWSYLDGTCETALPPGRLRISIEKGPEYERLEQQIQLPEGKLALRFDLKRLFDPQRDGWYSGAMVRTPLSPHDVLLEGAAEGLRVVDLLAYEREATIEGAEKRPVWKLPAPTLSEPTDSDAYILETLIDYPNLLAFSGQRPCLETADCLVAVNTLNRHGALGELALLNCHRVVHPLRVGRSTFEHSAYHRRDSWRLADWCDQCHRKNGLVIALSIHSYQDDPWYGGEGLADLILGKVDAIGRTDYAWWYTLLSLGLQMPIVSPCTLRPVGMARTYARLDPGQAFGYSGWIDAIRAGRTVFSWGPQLTLTVNGQDPGACIDLDRPGAIVKIRAEARARDKFGELMIVHDGQVVTARPARHDVVFRAEIEEEYPVEHDGWLAALCTHKPGPRGRHIDAHTSPIYLRVQTRAPDVDPAAVQRVMDCLDHTLTWVERDANCETPTDRERLASVFREAKQVLLKKLGE
jgi:hypothetical protein